MKNNTLKNKLINFKPEEPFLLGIQKLASAVGSTLGPLGNNVAIAEENDVPRIVHDGVSVAKSIKVSDPFVDMGIQLVKESALKTEDVTGDGTTTATILTHELVKNGYKLLNEGVKAMHLRRGMELAGKMLIEKIRETAVMKVDLQQVATISAQDAEIGQLVSEAFVKVGKDGIVEVEESKGRDIVLEYQEGMQIDSGYASPYFVTKGHDAELEDASVLIISKDLSSLKPLEAFFNRFIEESRTMLIIADSFEGDSLASLVVNKLKGTLNVVAVETPSYGDNAKGILEDLSALTGARIISQETGDKLEDVTMEDLGFLKKVIASKETTKLIGGEGDVSAQVEKLKSKLSQKGLGLIETQLLKERLARLTTGVALLHVGARTKVEMAEKKERAIDAVKATRAAMEEGILPGGAIAYPQLWNAMIEDTKTPPKLNADESKGFALVGRVIEKPFEILMQNSGIEAELSNEYGMGINVMTGEEVDMMEAGIVDPAKVVRSALENAISIASSILTTQTLIAIEPEKNQE